MMVLFIGSYHVGAGIFALCAYLIVGIFIPLWNGSRGGNTGMEFRAKFGELNSYVLDSLSTVLVELHALRHVGRTG